MDSDPQEPPPSNTKLASPNLYFIHKWIWCTITRKFGYLRASIHIAGYGRWRLVCGSVCHFMSVHTIRLPSALPVNSCSHRYEAPALQRRDHVVRDSFGRADWRQGFDPGYLTLRYSSTRRAILACSIQIYLPASSR